MNRAKKIGTVVSQCVFWTVLALILAVAVFLFVRGKRQEPTFVFGHSFLWVETGSMSPTIEEKSYILVKRSDGTDIRVGDVIVFVCRDTSQPICGSLVTHRVVAETEEGYRTKGDSALSVEDAWTVAPGDVVAVYCGNLSVLTVLARIFSSPLGLTMLCGLFLAVCGFLYIPSMIRAFRSDREDGENGDGGRDEKLRREEIARRIEREVERLERENGKSISGTGGTAEGGADDSANHGERSEDGCDRDR